MLSVPFFSIHNIHEQVAEDASHAIRLINRAHTNLNHTQPQLQAFRAVGDTPTTAPKGLLSGVSVSVKDLYAATGFDTYAGSPLALTEFNTSGTLVKRLTDAGAHICGKTHTVEFAFGGLGTNPHWPVPVNPFDTNQHRVPGGSSSGAPVSLWMGACQLALGSDTSGSVRVPAAFCGTFGLKTSAGRWEKDGIVPLSPSVDTAGLLALSAADALWGFAVMDPAISDNPRAFIAQTMLTKKSMKGVRIGVITALFEGCEGNIDNKVLAALTQLEAAGAVLVELDWPYLEETYQLFLQGGLSALEFPAFIKAPDRKPWFDQLAPSTKMRFAHLTDADLSNAPDQVADKNALIQTFNKAAEAVLATVDFAVCPTCPISAPTLAYVETNIEQYKERNFKALRNTQVANLQYLCAATLPCGLDDYDMPLGLQIIMGHGQDPLLMQWSCAVEVIIGDAQHHYTESP
ncbi:MAG: aspartyl-tRNA(Asn)/glutamyl-tRNA(Gln) amidotransferase subunit A [Oceanospirillaceae bacterium]|jgi:aspartyl-tRNA(Asn)/glutamyl-tRNA(Gln) amidotransferase subunit A